MTKREKNRTPEKGDAHHSHVCKRVLNRVVTNFNQKHSITQSSLSKPAEIMVRESPSWQKWTGSAKKDKSLLVLLCVEDPLMNGFNKDLIDCSRVRQTNKHL